MADDDQFFMRFRWPDADDLAREIEVARTQLGKAREAKDKVAELESLNRLGFCLTPAGQESEAVGCLEEALALARRFADQDAEIDILLNLATARQYLDEREVAQALFNEALRRAKNSGISRHNHFILHHQGRCHVEQGQIGEARRCFEQALELRRQLKDPTRIARTEAALEALAKLAKGS